MANHWQPCGSNASFMSSGPSGPGFMPCLSGNQPDGYVERDWTSLHSAYVSFSAPEHPASISLTGGTPVVPPYVMRFGRTSRSSPFGKVLKPRTLVGTATSIANAAISDRAREVVAIELV